MNNQKIQAVDDEEFLVFIERIKTIQFYDKNTVEAQTSEQRNKAETYQQRKKIKKQKTNKPRMPSLYWMEK